VVVHTSQIRHQAPLVRNPRCGGFASPSHTGLSRFPTTARLCCRNESLGPIDWLEDELYTGLQFVAVALVAYDLLGKTLVPWRLRVGVSVFSAG
jgi:hypothetical protein